MIIRTQDGWGTVATGGLYRVEVADGASLQTLVPESGAVSGFVGFLPDSAGKGVLFQSTAGGDVSLYRLDKIDGEPVVVPWTAVDDTAETWVGIVGVP
ncbi:MAG: hypothetical protein HUU55_23175 [Myxococcales bacterium]|nr:hypothetical protein [Myxococcales bacterium]